MSSRGAIHPFYKLAEAAVLAQARQVLAGSQRDLLELEIARAWLDQWFAPAPLPQIQDASTGDPLLLVTDHYKDVLAAHPAQREAWFAFERQAMESIARRWCEDHGISPR